MTTIVTRASKGAPLTWNEADANFTNLKTTADKASYVSGMSKSLIQVGTDSTASTAVITFSTPFKTATTPYITCVSNTSSGATNIQTIEINTISNTGFTLVKKQFNGTIISLVNYAVTWIAVGETT